MRVAAEAVTRLRPLVWRSTPLRRPHPAHGTGTIGVVLSLALVLVLAGCGLSVASSQRDKPVLLAEAKGLCPLQVPYVNNIPAECEYTRAWNASSPIFATPHRLWGVAYAFNCGSRAREFSFVARLPDMDHMALYGDDRHAKRGSGYVMYSRSAMLNLIAHVPPEFKFDGDNMEVDIASPCTWHVKAIRGLKSDVASAVPPIPAMMAPWWK